MEIYSKKYFTSRVKPDLDSTDTNISTLRQQIERKFKAESKEIQDEVMRIHEEQITNKDSTIVAKDDEEAYLEIDVEARQRFESYTLHHLIRAALITFYSHIQQCAPTLQQILDHLSRKTGWSFSVLMGGPDPVEPEGQCIVMR